MDHFLKQIHSVFLHLVTYGLCRRRYESDKNIKQTCYRLQSNTQMTSAATAEGSFPKGAFSFALLHASAPQRGHQAGGDIDTQATFKGGCTDIAKVSAAFNPL